MSSVPRRLLTAAVRDRVDAIANLTVYLREVAPNPPTISADDLRVLPYAVIYPSPGVPVDSRFCGDRARLSWTVQVTCVAGDNEAIDPVVDAVTAQLEGWRPVLPEPHDALRIGKLRLLNDPGPSRRDDDVAPARFYVPLIYGLAI